MRILSPTIVLLLIWGSAPVYVAESIETESNSADSPLIIQDIAYKKETDTSEIVFIQLNRFSWPSILHALEENPPVLEIEWTYAQIQLDDVSPIPVNGQWINRIRYHYHPDRKVLKILLDLNPFDGYKVSQAFDKAKNVFAVKICVDKIPQGERTRASQEIKTVSLQKENDADIFVSLINAWRKAWENKNLNSYMGFYHRDFKSEGKNRSAWENSKSRTFNEVKRISVSLSDLKIKTTENSTTAFFEQTYQSDTYQDEGYKLLEFKKEKDTWKIIREKWYEKKPDNWPSPFRP